jgi:hypothetical protein
MRQRTYWIDKSNAEEYRKKTKPKGSNATLTEQPIQDGLAGSSTIFIVEIRRNWQYHNEVRRIKARQRAMRPLIDPLRKTLANMERRIRKLEKGV